MEIAGWFFGVLVFLVLIIYLRHFVPLRRKENGFHFVHVDEDKTVRELDDGEKEYLTEAFDPNDGARPYIKSRFYSRTPDGKIHGFIFRKRVPFWITIK